MPFTPAAGKPVNSLQRIHTVRAIGALFLLVAASASAAAEPGFDRGALIARSRVWMPVDVAAMDLRRGPAGPRAFTPGQTVHCDYLEKDFDGASKKFACRLTPGDEVKVKFGIDNGEVRGEVAATRLLWALGFGADRMYPVRVICRGCPASIGDVVDPAVIERRMPGKDLPDDGWSWMELDLIDERAGGSPKAHVDALKLLAVLLQHTDSKREQQRLLCLDEACARPFMMIADPGLTFGAANLVNANSVASVNLRAWSETPVWKGSLGCVGNVPKSLTGTLKDPVIGDEGRRFLGDLLVRLSDRQLHDLFEVARVARPSRAADSTDDWVTSFKRKRGEILDRRCFDSWSTVAPPSFGVAPIIWLQSHRSPRFTWLMNVVSLFGYTPVYVAASVMLALLYRVRAGAALLMLMTLNGLVVNAAKAGVSFPRPDAVDTRIETIGAPRSPFTSTSRLKEIFPEGASPQRVDYGAYGFPSGHVAAATAFWLGLVFIFGWRRAWVGLVTWVPIVALSRMYLGRHFLGDVLGGFGVGVIVTAIGILGLNLARLGNPATAADRARRIARRVLLIGGALTASGVMLGVPDPLDASRLLGLAAGVMLIVGRDGELDAAPIARKLVRLGIAAVMFPLVSWAILQAAEGARAGDAARALLIGAVPALVLLPAALYRFRVGSE